MKRLAILIAWYFAFKVETMTSGIYAIIVKGPFPTELACQSEFIKDYTGMIEMLGVTGFQATKCTEKLAI